MNMNAFRYSSTYNAFHLERKEKENITPFRAWIKLNQIFHMERIQRHQFSTCQIHFISLDSLSYQT